MSGFLTSAVSMILVLGFMIFIHELGHFIAAKSLAVRVEQFAIGFGKRLFGFKRGDTDYRVNVLPLGGYVKMAGENPGEQRTGDPGEFMSHPRWHRFIIAIAGPAMNILLAIGLLTGVYMARYERPAFLDKAAVIGWVQPGSAADKAGIQPGDHIVRIDGIQNPRWEDVLPKVVLSPDQPVSLAVQRGNEILDKSITPVPKGPEQFGSPGWVPDQPSVITDLEPGMPAAKAGLKVGDIIHAVNGVPVRSMPAIIQTIQANKDKPLDYTVLRDGKELHFNISAESAVSEDGESMYRIGIRSDPTTVEKLPFAKAVSKSLETNKKYSLLIFELVEKMVQRKVSMKQMEGPIGIAAATGEAARQPGWTPLLALTAMISLNLGIFNLFPIPILDGGVILLLFVEGLMRRDINQALKERIYQAAFVFLLLFAAVVIYNDLVKQLPGWTGKLP
ncbi:MAG: RIP metalloprotease RseP [Terriglobales bacterium]